MKRFLCLMYVLFGLILVVYVYSLIIPKGDEGQQNDPNPAIRGMVMGWLDLSGDRKGKVIFARPPHLVVLNLFSGDSKNIPNIIVEGGKGRINRGKSPRPSWSADGERFLYRYNNRIYVSDEAGNKRAIVNEKMDCSHETRWSWWTNKRIDWLAGPSLGGDVILVKVSDPSMTKVAYMGGDVKKHCEITGNNYVVYDNGSSIYVTALFSRKKGIIVSRGQSCRPCAAPDNRVAWLANPHVSYKIHDTITGKLVGELKAPPQEELYRLNWSNDSDFAVHMFGSRGNERMHIRKISSGEALFVGNGWDPDLWVEIHPEGGKDDIRVNRRTDQL